MSCLFDSDSIFSIQEQDNITLGCEQRYLSPKSSISDLEAAYLDEEDDYLVHIDQSSLKGSAFQVWEKCMDSFIDSLDKPTFKNINHHAIARI